ncbi:hypothetical protein Tdes44962_MAKER08518 [Teratosphaeria destructans]|uniref:Uncharacterized protein n=1 Tax=Teratosphaeria destructans TaxID=418781 RepID=A0A9W7SWD8_9PEZI|nr:hypothetical protein Tdes44962_MAKER08518 [Teratosphaeria destructans]
MSLIVQQAEAKLNEAIASVNAAMQLPKPSTISSRFRRLPTLLKLLRFEIPIAADVAHAVKAVKDQLKPEIPTSTNIADVVKNRLNVPSARDIAKAVQGLLAIPDYVGLAQIVKDTILPPDTQSIAYALQTALQNNGALPTAKQTAKANAEAVHDMFADETSNFRDAITDIINESIFGDHPLEFVKRTISRTIFGADKMRNIVDMLKRLT